MRSFLCICLALTLNSVFGLSSPGETYVVSCPWLLKPVSCSAYIRTAEKVASVTVSVRLREKVISIFRYFVEYMKVLEYPLSNKTKHDHNSLRMAQNYPVHVFESPKQFLITVWSIHQKFYSSDIITLIPRSRCHKSYYTVTANGYPFFTIFSLGYPETRATFQCPEHIDYKPLVRMDSTAARDCAIGRTVIIRMVKYEAWYFVVDDLHANLMNVKINSDVPVFVVSGNALAWFKIQGSTDLAKTSLQPSTTWGKRYVVPDLVPVLRIFAISTLVKPFEVSIDEYVHDEIFTTMKYEYGSRQSGILTYGKSDNLLHIWAQSPFGLSQIIPSHKVVASEAVTDDVAIVSLIPVEQWDHGNFYVYINYESTFIMRNILLTRTEQDNVVFSVDPRDDGDLLKNTLEMEIKGRTYTVSDANLHNRKGRIYMNDTAGRLMIYCVVWHPVKPTLSIYPYYYFGAEIYQDDCEASAKVYANDGKDNDCDNYVDEEMNNGVDDDGDGSVDEDNVEPFSDGQWTQWAYVCNESIMDKTVVVRTRSCSQRSVFGAYCQGENIECGGEKCPAFQLNREVRMGSKCFCDAGCLTCDRNMYECDGCKAGYETTEHCLTLCRKGWKGIGCKEAVIEPGLLTNVFVIIAVLVLAVIFIVLMICCCLLSLFSSKESISSSTTSSLSSSLSTSSPSIPSISEHGVHHANDWV